MVNHQPALGFVLPCGDEGAVRASVAALGVAGLDLAGEQGVVAPAVYALRSAGGEALQPLHVVLHLVGEGLHALVGELDLAVLGFEVREVVPRHDDVVAGEHSRDAVHLVGVGVDEPDGDVLQLGVGLEEARVAHEVGQRDGVGEFAVVVADGQLGEGLGLHVRDLDPPQSVGAEPPAGLGVDFVADLRGVPLAALAGAAASVLCRDVGRVV